MDVNNETIEEMRQRLLQDSEVRELISMRAYELYLGRQSESGKEMEDWLRAENEILTIMVQEELRSRATYPVEERGQVTNHKPLTKPRSRRTDSGNESKRRGESTGNNKKAEIKASESERASAKPTPKTGKKSKIEAAEEGAAGKKTGNANKAANRKSAANSNENLKSGIKTNKALVKTAPSGDLAEKKPGSAKSKK